MHAVPNNQQRGKYRYEGTKNCGEPSVISQALLLIRPQTSEVADPVIFNPWTTVSCPTMISTIVIRLQGFGDLLKVIVGIAWTPILETESSTADNLLRLTCPQRSTPASQSAALSISTPRNMKDPRTTSNEPCRRYETTETIPVETLQTEAGLGATA